MDVDLIFKIAAIGILVAVLNQLLIRSGREEQGLMVVLAGAIGVSRLGIGGVSDQETAQESADAPAAPQYSVGAEIREIP